MMYGIPGTYWHAMLAEQKGPVFVQELNRQGYESAIFSRAPATYPELHRTAFADVKNLRLRSDGNTPASRDVDMTQDFLDFLDGRSWDSPFFGLLFYNASHGFDVPKDYPKLFEPSWDEVNYLALKPDLDPEPFYNLYLNSLHFVDDLVGRAIDRLESLGQLDNTIIVITGDHGQEFNENGLNYWGHNGNFSRYQVRVPMVVHWPGKTPATYEHRTSHFDIVPTLFDELFACTNDVADYSVGRSLFEPGHREILLLANYNDYALVLPDRIVAVYSYGVEILDERYRPIPGASLDREVMQTALHLRGRFFR